MNKEFSIPPKSPDLLTASSIIATRLAPLISKSFELTDKARTNGSNLRKLVAQELENHSLIDSADIRDYEIIPPKGKGVPKIRR